MDKINTYHFDYLIKVHKCGRVKHKLIVNKQPFWYKICWKCLIIKKREKNVFENICHVVGRFNKLNIRANICSTNLLIWTMQTYFFDGNFSIVHISQTICLFGTNRKNYKHTHIHQPNEKPGPRWTRSGLWREEIVFFSHLKTLILKTQHRNFIFILFLFLREWKMCYFVGCLVIYDFHRS